MLNKITDYIDKKEKEIVKFNSSLIQTRPVNPVFVDGKYSEERVQEVIKQKLTDLGLEV